MSPRSEPRSALPNLPMHPISYSSFRALPASPVRISCGHRHRAGPLRFTLHLSFVADQSVCGRWLGLISGSLQGLHYVPCGSGHARRRMPHPDDTPRCVWRHQLRNRVGQVPSSHRRSRHQEGRGRSAARDRHRRNRPAVLGIRRCTDCALAAADPPGLHRLRTLYA